MNIRRKRAAAPAPARISLSILEPACRCREPIIDEAVRHRREITLDLRTTHFAGHAAPILRAAWKLGDDECIRAHVRAIPYPLLAAIQASGHRFQIVARGADHVELLVWNFLSPDQRQLYLQDGIGRESITPAPSRN